MDDKAKGLELLNNTILKTLRHKDYERVTALAKKYFDIFTGEGINDYLRQVMRREDSEMFEQRKKLYTTTIPAAVESIVVTFNKPLRSNRIYSSIEHPDSKARDEITERMRSFWQGESESGVDAYLRDRWVPLEVYDPNAFIAVEFGAFDPAKEKPWPFPFEYSSAEAINYQYRNGILDWIITMVPILYRTDVSDPEKTESGSRYVMYLDNWAISLTQVDIKKRITDRTAAVFHEVKDAKGIVQSVYVIEEFNTKAGAVPLFRAGHKLDPVTQRRTCVSILHPALNFFLKEIKTGSELDITMAMHAFPQKIQYGKRCEGNREKGIICNDGKTPTGTDCPECGGSKIAPIHKTAMDIMLVAPPKKPGDPVLDLEKAVVYKAPPVELIRFQEEYLERITEKAKAAVFASQAVLRTQVEKSATELDYGMDNVYDTLEPFAIKYSYAWRFFVNQIAIYTDNASPQLVVYHSFPKDFKFKTLGQLLAEAKTASESGLSQHAVDAVNNDILEVLYADDQDTLTRIKVKNRFHPFSGKGKDEMASIVMSGDILPYYKTLYLYFDVIFDEIDNELGDRFYLMQYPKQKEVVRGKVDAILKEIAKNSPKPFANSLRETVEEELESAT